MRKHPGLKPFIYALVILLSLAALWLVANAPSTYLNTRPVYQGF